MGRRLVRVVGSASCFFWSGLTVANFHSLGTLASDREAFIVLFMTGLIGSIISCRIEVGHGSKGEADLTARVTWRV